MMDYQTNETNAIFNPTSYSKVAFRKRNQRIKVKLWRQERIIVRLMLLLLCLVSAYTVITMDYGNVKLTEAVSAFFPICSIFSCVRSYLEDLRRFL